jgi:VWFA-related protein
MTRRLPGPGVVAFVAVGWLLTTPSAQAPAPIVPIEVAVTTGGGSVAGLSREEFEVSIDGAPAPIAAFAAGPAPITVALLLDVTASMTNYGDLGDELDRSFARALEPGDRGRAGGIANRLQLAPEFTSDRRALVAAARKAIDFRKEDRFGPSPIWDGLDATIAALEQERGRRGVILVTDGRATGNAKGAASVINRAVASGVVVHVLSESRTLIIRQGETSAARVRAGLALEELARMTGGVLLPENPPESGEFPDAGPLISRLVEDLRAMYTLGVSAAGPAGRAYTISVRVKRPGVVVRARVGYRTP